MTMHIYSKFHVIFNSKHDVAQKKYFHEKENHLYLITKVTVTLINKVTLTSIRDTAHNMTMQMYPKFMMIPSII